MENSDSDNLSCHSLDKTETENDSIIIDLSTDFPRLKNSDINSSNYYTSTSFEKIFKDSSSDINNSLNILHLITIISVRNIKMHQYLREIIQILI